MQKINTGMTVINGRTAAVTMETIVSVLPTRPSVRTMQRKWRELGAPIREDKLTRKKYAYVDELTLWIQQNENNL